MKPLTASSLKFFTVFTLILFGALTATAGILGTLGKETEAPAPAEDTLPESMEVFQFTEEEISCDVFAAFISPLTGRVSSPYGYRTDPFSGEIAFHRGTDVAVEEGTEISAVAEGTVTAASFDRVGGNYIRIRHENGTESYYGHLQTRLVSKGDRVEQGQIIGLSGATGKVTGAHLHFQLSYNGRTVDPQRYLDLAP